MSLTADVVVCAPAVLTMDDDQPVVEAVACRDGRIVYAGSVSQALAAGGPRTEVIEYDEGIAMPAFVDAHTHFARLGELAALVDLGEAGDRDEALEMLRVRAVDTPPSHWVVGWNWDESNWPGGDHLSPTELDTVSDEHPVMARRVDGHLAVVNRPALGVLGLSEDLPGYDGSQVLTEDAADEAWRRAAPDLETATEGLDEARALADRLGIGAVHDMVGRRDLQLWSRAVTGRMGLPAARLYLFRELLDHAEPMGLGPLGGDVALCGVKMYTDGSLGAYTAALAPPYAYQDRDTDGVLLIDAKGVEATARRAASLGLQVAAHAIGNRAVRAVLDGFAAAPLTPDQRPRIEHAECLTRDLVDRMAGIGAVASVQPNFTGNWGLPGDMYADRLGGGALASMNPLRELLDAGVPVAIGSDGMPYGPLYGVHWAINGPSPKQRLPPDEALRAATATAAWAGFDEKRRGALRPGMAADVVVLSGDPRRDPTRVQDMEVACTVRGGRVVRDAHGDA